MSCVYLLSDFSDDNVYKIGVTRGNPEKRIKKLQTGNAGEIILLQKYETEIPFYIEKWMHFKLGSKKINNEWFKLSDEDVFNFKNMCKEIEEMYNTMKDNVFFNVKK